LPLKWPLEQPALPDVQDPPVVTVEFDWPPLAPRTLDAACDALLVAEVVGLLVVAAFFAFAASVLGAGCEAPLLA
jgi:hypothetical protein